MNCLIISLKEFLFVGHSGSSVDKVFDAKIDNMGSIPGAHVVKGREPVPAGFLLTVTDKINVRKRNFLYI